MDEQWQHINRFIPKRKRAQGGKGRPAVDNRMVLKGILWVMWAGAPLTALPSYYGSRATCHRRFQEWTRDGTIRNIFKYLVWGSSFKAIVTKKKPERVIGDKAYASQALRAQLADEGIELIAPEAFLR